LLPAFTQEVLDLLATLARIAPLAGVNSDTGLSNCIEIPAHASCLKLVTTSIAPSGILRMLPWQLAQTAYHIAVI
jgi:hypothetical protein